MIREREGKGGREIVIEGEGGKGGEMKGELLSCSSAYNSEMEMVR